MTTPANTSACCAWPPARHWRWPASGAEQGLAWWLSGSVSLLAGLTDSALDAVASFLNLLAVHYALRPADDDHRFGHGKAEALAGMAQALFIGAVRC
jgi:divalent metal cation (Fe/Co/Zn/Cd) transporter